MVLIRSSNSFRILRYSSVAVVILSIGNDCFCGLHGYLPFLKSSSAHHGHMGSVYPTGRIDAFCVWYVRLDFQHICDVIILLFNLEECRIDKWIITITMHTRHMVSTNWQLHCLLNSSFRQTWKKTPSWSFVRGIYRQGNRRILDHPKLHSSHPLQRESSGDQWFHRTQGQ